LVNAESKTGRVTFSFDERKAAAATALLLNLAKGQMEYMLLIKLLYRADRESIEKYGLPIIGDRYVGMDWGTVLSRVYDRVRRIAKEKETIPGWQGVERLSNVAIKLKGPPELGPLSDADTAILVDVFNRFGGEDPFVAGLGTHNLPEFTAPPPGRAVDIDPETILRVLDKSEEEIEQIAQRAREQAHFAALFRA
jgi:Protein of unknown function (DUF4065)